ncbi:Lanthionine synthetase C-like [Trinorchestia longiramus]|nr:Lanthionine synthetase C-like [Trinorchestia longiramus]
MSRYFKNPFANYSEEAAHHVLTRSENDVQISEDYKKKLLETIGELKSLIEKKCAQWERNHDYSIYTGSAGLAVVLLHSYAKLGNLQDLKKAEKIAEHCVGAVGSRSRFTYLCGDGGLLVTAALVAHIASSSPSPASRLKSPQYYVDKLLALSPRIVADQEVPDELLYGRAGYLYCLLLLRSSKVCSDQLRPTVEAVVRAMLRSGQELATRQGRKDTPLMYEWHDKKYLGAAHGLVGILVLLMQAKEHLPSNALEELIRPSVDFLQARLYPSGNLPSSEGSSSGDKLVHWCHGAPGAAIMFAMAHQVFNSPEYLATSRRCAKTVWERGLLKKGYGLCHGAAGNAYCFLYLHQVTGEPEFLYKAAQFGAWCQQYGEHGCSIPDRPYSLFEGLAGNLHFLLDLLDVDHAAFPAFVLPIVT